MSKCNYGDLVPQEFRDRIQACPVAYLPLGTLEWHGEHLPLGTDFHQPLKLFEVLAEKMGGIVFPPLFFGPDMAEEVDGEAYYGMELGEKRPVSKIRYKTQKLDGSCYWVETPLFKQIFESILLQMKKAGFKLLVGHGHGPSGGFIREHAEEMEKKYGIRCVHCWDDTCSDIETEAFQTGHAGTNETSLMMYLCPDLVQMERLDNNSDQVPIGVSEDPRRSVVSAELGKKIFDRAVERMSGIIRRELAELN